tara:strand:- start:4742 stop:5749 length:1008 start_codon:yes stop_codon:yes gene_type:complete
MKVAIIGCGKIFPRHFESIQKNKNFSLVALCDTNKEIVENLSRKHKVSGYVFYKEMLKKESIDLAVIATPNSMHFKQAKHCLRSGVDVLIEKPASLSPEKIKKIEKIAKQNKKNAYCVLQVRLNPVVQKVKKLLEKNILGEIRGISLVQRWQRPVEYFSDWRGDPTIGGGTLHECGIHYLDILCYLFGRPEIVSSKSYNTKHKATQIEDTIYSILDYGKFGGTVEVTISAEPKNIECSISILTDRAFLKIGGLALDKVEEVKFLDNEVKFKKKYDKLMKDLSNPREINSYGAYSGSCPNHPELYRNLDDFNISEAYSSLKMIEKIYEKCGVEYSE